MRLSEYLRELAKIPSQASAEVARRFSAKIQEGFDAGTDPRGALWAPLAPATLARGRTPPPLTDTGRGRRGVTVRPTSGAGIRIDSSVDYMQYHLRGNSKLPARPFVPLDEIPEEWRAIWAEVMMGIAAKKKLNHLLMG